MRASFDVNALRMMVVGAELGSFARAAAKLGRSQSAVSMQLKKLEEQAGKALFRRSGRGLVPTEAGEALLAYARRIVTLNDEAAASLGAISATASVRLGMPQDFAEDVLPQVILAFMRKWPQIEVEAHAGRNYRLGDDVRSGRLDLAIAYAREGEESAGSCIARLPMRWLAGRKLKDPLHTDAVPFVLYDHPCLFRQTAFESLEHWDRRWRIALTTPSLPGVWAALHSGLGITIRTGYRLPVYVQDARKQFGLPKLPQVELRLHAGPGLSPAASDLRDILTQVVTLRLRDQTARRR